MNRKPLKLLHDSMTIALVMMNSHSPTCVVTRNSQRETLWKRVIVTTRVKQLDKVNKAARIVARNVRKENTESAPWWLQNETPCRDEKPFTCSWAFTFSVTFSSSNYGKKFMNRKPLNLLHDVIIIALAMMNSPSPVCVVTRNSQWETLWKGVIIPTRVKQLDKMNIAPRIVARNVQKESTESAPWSPPEWNTLSWWKAIHLLMSIHIQLLQLWQEIMNRKALKLLHDAMIIALVMMNSHSPACVVTKNCKEKPFESAS